MVLLQGIARSEAEGEGEAVLPWPDRMVGVRTLLLRAVAAVVVSTQRIQGPNKPEVLAEALDGMPCQLVAVAVRVAGCTLPELQVQTG